MKSRLIYFSFLITGILFCLLVVQNMPAYGEISTGFHLGYSSNFEEEPYKIGDDDWFDTHHLGLVYGFQFQYFFKDKKSGFSLEISRQNSEIKNHYLVDGVWTSIPPVSRYAYFLSLYYDFRFFSATNKTINPYLSLGGYFASSLFDDEPAYMMGKSNIGIEIRSGLRFKLGSKFFMNSSINYFPIYGFFSGKIGFEFVF